MLTTRTWHWTAASLLALGLLPWLGHCSTSDGAGAGAGGGVSGAAGFGVGGGSTATGSGGSSAGGGSSGGPGAGGDSAQGRAGATGAAGTSSNTGGGSGRTGIADASVAPVDAGPASPTSACGSTTAAQGLGVNTTYTLEVDGKTRSYIVWVPSNYDASRPYRLILTWHGLGGTAEQIATGYGYSGFAFYGLQSLAGSSAIFVSGQGLDIGDSGAGWANTNDADIHFVKAILDWIRPLYCIDDARIFSVGMSYGGIMSNTIGCELGGPTFRAIAPASGMGPGYGSRAPSCAGGQVGVWLAHGSADQTVALDAGKGSRDYWLGRNHCGSATVPASVAPCVNYQGCDPQYPVTWCEFDGGHTIPNFEAQATWDFLKQF